MKTWTIVFCLIWGFTAYQPLQAQNTKQNKSQSCEDFHIHHCKFKDKDPDFQYNRQSRSAFVRPGQICVFTISAFKGITYRMTFNAEEKILHEMPIMYKVIDARTKKVFFETTRKEGFTDFEFVCDNSLNIEIQVQLPDVRYVSKDKILYGCLGFLLESKYSSKTVL